MNKRFTFALLMLGGILTLSSCSEDKDMEVFVGDNFSTDRQKIIDELNALNFPTSFTESDDKHPEYKKMDPETYSSKQRTEGKGLEGYYGYVDLGLSVKWAASKYSIKPEAPPSRPKPLCFTPPKGASAALGTTSTRTTYLTYGT